MRYLTRKLAALHDITCSIAPGQRVLLCGASGSGKSTLGLCLAGLIPQSIDADVSGVVLVDGQPTTAYAPGSLADRVGVVFQDPTSQFTLLTVEDEVAFGLENLGVPSDEMPARISAALTTVGLADRAGWRIDRLSGGQQQRVALAAALAMQPGALVLDEPTAHLDPRSASEVFEAIDRVTGTVVFIEHDLDRLLPHMPDRALLLDRTGGIALDGPLKGVLGTRKTATRAMELGVRLPTPWAIHLGLQQPEAVPVRSARGANVIRAHDVWHRYRSPADTFTALRGVDLDVAEGELVALVGANGSGKTTLLRALTGLLPLSGGEISIAGVDLRKASPRQVAGLVAHVFQNPEAGFVADSVEEELAYGPRALGWPEQRVTQHTAALLERFGLQALARANPFTLSQGQKRRLSVATSLVLGPRALLLDEPTFGQDRQTAQALLEEIASLRSQGMAIVVATHDLSLVRAIATRVVALGNGEVLFDGAYAELIRQPRLLERIGQEVPTIDRALVAL